MITLSIVMMLAADAALPSYTLPPSRPAAPTRCMDECASRYRLPSASTDAAAPKKRALAEDGVDCNVTRSKICRVRPHTWIRANY